MSITAQRREFVADWRRAVWSMTELCARYAVARKTGYKWIARYEAAGQSGLQERSRCPHTRPTAIAPALVAAIVALRCQHPRWGPRKLRVLLQRYDPSVAWQARSTVAKILRREGLVPALRRRVRRAPAPAALDSWPRRPTTFGRSTSKGNSRRVTGCIAIPSP